MASGLICLRPINSLALMRMRTMRMMMMMMMMMDKFTLTWLPITVSIRLLAKCCLYINQHHCGPTAICGKWNGFRIGNKPAVSKIQQFVVWKLYARLLYTTTTCFTSPVRRQLPFRLHTMETTTYAMELLIFCTKVRDTFMTFHKLQILLRPYAFVVYTLTISIYHYVNK